MTTSDLVRAERRARLIVDINRWMDQTDVGPLTPDDRLPSSRPDLVTFLLEAGWRPAYDGAIEIVEDTAGEWRWRAVARNAEPVAGPQEGYVDREHAELMAQRITGIYLDEQATP